MYACVFYIFQVTKSLLKVLHKDISIFRLFFLLFGTREMAKMKHFNESCKEKDGKFAGMFVFISDFIILFFLIQMPLPVWSDLFYIQVLKADADTLYCILFQEEVSFCLSEFIFVNILYNKRNNGLSIWSSSRIAWSGGSKLFIMQKTS